MSGGALKEVLGVQNGLLFCEEALSPVFCKPKLIPLKSVTLEKLEKMQKESVEAMMKQMQEKNHARPDVVNFFNDLRKVLSELYVLG
ncbi:unnamed protein product [Gongylonema pulchrum]|uniref:KTN1 n=1 Tax=Gongylonema pulchrum TaxID=637853 RepID=A0A183E3E1_9BILA|nr:unnamed protein product [Gongylonema pulchrum]